MRRLGVVAIGVMAFTAICVRAQAGTDEQFWTWFVAHEPRLFAFESDQERVFDELTRELTGVNADLTFEFGPVANGKREFVISAGGIRSAFPAVESLYRTAPMLPRWTWVKFRPRRFPIHDLNYGGKAVKADDVRFLLAKDGEKVGIALFFDGYSEAEKRTYGQIGYLFLDEALGEYAVETQVGAIEFLSKDSKYFPQSRPLPELPHAFDDYWAHPAP